MKRLNHRKGIFGVTDDGCDLRTSNSNFHSLKNNIGSISEESRIITNGTKNGTDPEESSNKIIVLKCHDSSESIQKPVKSVGKSDKRTSVVTNHNDDTKEEIFSHDNRPGSSTDVRIDNNNGNKDVTIPSGQEID